MQEALCCETAQDGQSWGAGGRCPRCRAQARGSSQKPLAGSLQHLYRVSSTPHQLAENGYLKGPARFSRAVDAGLICGREATVSWPPFLRIWTASGRQAVFPPISERLGKVTFKEAKPFVLDANSRFLNII